MSSMPEWETARTVAGYVLCDGTSLIEVTFPSGKPSKATLEMVAWALRDGWILTRVILRHNAKSDSR